MMTHMNHLVRGWKGRVYECVTRFKWKCFMLKCLEKCNFTTCECKNHKFNLWIPLFHYFFHDHFYDFFHPLNIFKWKFLFFEMYDILACTCTAKQRTKESFNFQRITSYMGDTKHKLRLFRMLSNSGSHVVMRDCLGTIPYLSL